MSLNYIERGVLAAYKEQCENDPEGAFGPVWGPIAMAHPDRDPEAVLVVCKQLKRRGLLDGTVARGRLAIVQSSFWITDDGVEALR